MKTLSLLIAGTTILLSMRPTPAGIAQQAATHIATSTKTDVTDSLEDVLVERSRRSLEKSRKLVDIARKVKAQSEEIARQERHHVVLQHTIVVEKDTCIETCAKPIARKSFFFRLFHRSK